MIEIRDHSSLSALYTKFTTEKKEIMYHVLILPSELMTFYRFTKFSMCFITDHKDEHDQDQRSLTIVGVHDELGLVTIMQDMYSAFLISEFCYELEDAIYPWSMDMVADLGVIESQTEMAFQFAIAKAEAYGLDVSTIKTSIHFQPAETEKLSQKIVS